MFDHVTIRVREREESARFYDTVLGVLGIPAGELAAGYRTNGAPGERPDYHPGYYGAFVLDPDGTNVESVYHGRG